MSLFTVDVLFSDTKVWAIGYLQAALNARAESYTTSVSVRATTPAETTDDPWPTSGRVVTIRDDGGNRVGPVFRNVALGVKVFGPTAQQAADLSRMVTALLEASAGSGDVVAHVSTAGPVEVAEESKRSSRYVSVVLQVRGSAL